MDFWCDVGTINELPTWADSANLELGVIHTDVWELYSNPEKNKAKEILINIAHTINGFYPKSLEAKPYAINSFKKARLKFTNDEINIQEPCKLVEKIDIVFITPNRLKKNPFDSQLKRILAIPDGLGIYIIAATGAMKVGREKVALT